MHHATLLDERRKLERHPCHLRCTCTPCSSGSHVQWTGRVVDLSCAGIRLVAERRFESGTLLRILLRNNAGQPVASLLGRVIYLTAQSEGCWLMGCSISPELTEEGLEILLSS